MSGKKNKQARKEAAAEEVEEQEARIVLDPYSIPKVIPKEESKIKLSMVAIVKNEEAVLERCIKSVESIIDEFIIVDTGSTDGTKDIIKKYGKLYELPYTTEVETKQKAIELATGDYVLLMDADEWVFQNAEKFRQYAQNNIELVSVRICNVTYHKSIITNKYYRDRFFKRSTAKGYAGPNAHGYVDHDKPPITDRSILIYHDKDHMIGDENKAKSKLDRTLNPLQDAVDTTPTSSRAWFYLARTYMNPPTSDYKKAIETYQHYLGMIESTFTEERWWAVYDIARCYSALNDFENAMKACDRTIEMDPKRAEGLVLKGKLYVTQSQWHLASFYLKEAMERTEPDSQLFVDPRQYWEEPASYLAFCKYQTEDLWGAFELTRELIGRQAFVEPKLVGNLIYYQEQMALRNK